MTKKTRITVTRMTPSRRRATAPVTAFVFFLALAALTDLAGLTDLTGLTLLAGLTFLAGGRDRPTDCLLYTSRCV